MKKLKVVLTFEFSTDPDWYGTDDIKQIIDIEKDNAKSDLYEFIHNADGEDFDIDITEVKKETN